MNKTIILGTWRYMLHSPLRLLMLALFLWGTYLALGTVSQSMLGGPQGLWVYLNVFGNLLAWTLGVGIIRSDRASGVLALVLLRPLSRMQYALSKWLALFAACWAIILLVAILFSVAHPGPAMNGLGFWEALGATLVLSASASAVVVLFSSIPFGLGDLSLLALFLLSNWVASMLISSNHLDFLSGLPAFLLRVVLPFYPVPSQANMDPAILPFAGMQLAVAVLALAAAVELVKRMELNYGEAN